MPLGSGWSDGKKWVMGIFSALIVASIIGGASKLLQPTEQTDVQKPAQPHLSPSPSGSDKPYPATDTQNAGDDSQRDNDERLTEIKPELSKLAATKEMSSEPITKADSATSFDSCGFYRDVYGNWNSWMTYSPAMHGVERFWVACRVQTKVRINVTGVKTNLKTDESFALGFEDQQFFTSAAIEPNSPVWIAVPIEENEYEDAVRTFREPSAFELLLADTKETNIHGTLPALQIERTPSYGQKSRSRGDANPDRSSGRTPPSHAVPPLIS